MNTAQQVIKRSDLLKRRAIDRQTVDEVGRVEQLWLDPQSQRTIGFTCKSGFLGQRKRWFGWEQVETVGETILVNVGVEAAAQQPPGAIAIVGGEVLTDAGNKVGVLSDYLFDVTTGSVVSYLFKSSGWRGVLDGIYVLPPGAIVNLGSKRAIVAESALSELQKYAEGLNQRVAQAKEAIEQDLRHTLEDAEVLRRNAQRLAEEAQKRAQVVREMAQDQAQVVRERAQTVKDLAQDQAQVVRERAQAVRDLAQERIEQLRHRRDDVEPPTVVESVEDANEPQLPKDSEL